MVAPLRVDDVPIKSLYEKETYECETEDGWVLCITRYKPVPQAFAQPLRNVPLLLVHGFSQNRHAWSSGEFVKNLLYFGADVHILELRGHGKSTVELQRSRCHERSRPLPRDLDYGWNFDSYALYDVPAAIAAVKQRTGMERIGYIGHSMGGMIGYYQAAKRTDLLCLVTIGASAELGKDSFSLRLISHFEPALSAVIDTAMSGANLMLGELPKLAGKRSLGKHFAYKYFPMDWVFDLLDRALSERNFVRYQRFSPLLVLLFNPKHANFEGVQWILRRGTGREPRGVLEQFARWIRTQKMTIEATGEDIKTLYSSIRLPLAIIFGDRDVLATMKSTRRIYHQAQSDYLLWRPVRGNSHIELTMGYDIRQICYDIKNIVEYAMHAGDYAHALPRRGLPALPG
jgi:pimeloyl-ACP methyl ester carboxylesterase